MAGGTAKTPVGWYGDPVVIGKQRWWDGAQWGPRTTRIGSS